MNKRAFAFSLLALANLLWAGNWVIGRALRGAFDPVALNFWRWLIAALVLAPFALPELARARARLPACSTSVSPPRSLPSSAQGLR
jgi:drug/metabolite transporter (DMT)-like permease